MRYTPRTPPLTDQYVTRNQYLYDELRHIAKALDAILARLEKLENPSP